jgi:UDP-glucose 4-epimerase
VAALDHLMAGGTSAAFNVGTGAGQTVMEVLRAVEEITGKPVAYKIAPRREGDPMELVADSKKLRETLCWEPRRSGIQEIVSDAWAYYQSKFN